MGRRGGSGGGSIVAVGASVGKNVGKLANVGTDATAKALKSLPFDLWLNKIFSQPEMWWLKTTLPLAEYLLLLVVLVLFLEVAPQDIPAKCSNELHETCLAKYYALDGDFEAGYLGVPCGRSRVECWRGGIKRTIYNGQDMPPDTYYKTGVNERIVSIGLGNNTAAQAEMCQCLLTANGTVAYPISPEAARDDTEYFCDALLASVNVGTVGLILSGFVVLLKSKLEEVSQMDTVSDMQVAVYHFLIGLFWLAWSCLVVVETKSYSGKDAFKNSDCEPPEGNIFFFVFVIAVISLTGACYATYISIRVAVQLVRDRDAAAANSPTKSPSLHELEAAKNGSAGGLAMPTEGHSISTV